MGPPLLQFTDMPIQSQIKLSLKKVLGNVS